MATKFSPTYANGAREDATHGLSPPALPQRERTDKRSGAASLRPRSEIAQPAAPMRAPAGFDRALIA